MKTITKLTCGVISAMALSLVTASAQYTLSGTNPSISENFDSMTSTGTTPPAGWFVGTSLSGGTGGSSGTNGTFTADGVTPGTGSSTTGANYNFGVAGVNPVTDRALGSLASGTGNTRVTEARFVNSTSLTITGMVVSYTGEQWRNSASANAQELDLFASLGGSTFTALGSSFNFVSPTTGGTAGALDGNASANRTAGRGGSVDLTSLLGGLPNGGTLYLRWVDINDVGNDHGLAIDDLTVNFSNVATIPEPSTVVLVGAGLIGLLALRRRS